MSEQEAGDRKTSDTFETLSSTLDGWRARIDELLVQFDLAEHEVRDRVRKHIDVTENVYLAARSQLADARRDAHADVETVCRGTEKLIRDLQQAFQAAEAAFHRVHAE
jgi:outer membrane protein TolC